MKLHFRKVGSGPPILLLHGLLGSLDNWQPVAHRLADAFTVFALDLRNHGHSPHSAEMSLDAFCADVEEFLRDHGLARAHLIGHSYGGRVVMQFALQWPDRVLRLVVADISPRAPDPARSASMRSMLAALRALDVRAARSREELDAALAPAVPDARVRQFLLKNLARDPAGGFRWKINLDAFWANYDRLAVGVRGDGPCPCPALFLRGERSDFLLPEDEPLIRRLFPRAEIHTVPGAGHWLQAEQPDAVAARIRDFLTRAGEH
jgi:esterase